MTAIYASCAFGNYLWLPWFTCQCLIAVYYV